MRKSVYGIYVLTIISIVLFNATMSGYIYRFLPDAHSFQHISPYVFSLTSAIAITWFGISFLRTKKHAPKIHRALKILIALYFAGLLLTLFLPLYFVAKIASISALICMLIMCLVAFKMYCSGNKSAKYFLLGQGVILFGAGFVALSSQGLIPAYQMSTDIIKLCSAFELIFFSIGLSDSFKKAKQDKEKAQAMLIANQQTQNKQLDDEVTKRTKDLERANIKLAELSTTDELTGLKNRRVLNEILAQEYNRAYRNKTSIAVLIIDIDFFKMVNDKFGHLFGDKCLEVSGKIISSSIGRPPDLAVRYGGEEFLVLLPGNDYKGALSVAESIRTKFEKTVISKDAINETITVSIGVANIIPVSQSQHEQLLMTADKELYKAKDQGRNKIRGVDLNNV